jgi:succinate dehydrogenase / fumarate reductase cytochrome b subunit
MAPGSMNAEPPVPAVRDRRGLAKKLHSLSGVVPLGAYLVLHLWMTSSIVGSRDVYDRQVGFIHSGVLGILEPLIIAPLFFHAIYGLIRVLGPRDPDHAYDTDALLMLQRVSGVVVLVFLGLHLWEFRAQTWMRGLGESAYSTKLVLDLSSTTYSVPLIALGYIVGTAGCVFHLVNGMTSFCATWGLTRTEAAKARARITFRVAGVLLFALSAAMVIQLATGTRLFPATESALGPTECGPNTPPVEAPPHALSAQKAPRSAPPSPSASPTTVPSGSAPLPSGGH